ncbi:MAG TPA: YCF48-related protein [Steroidobacteraceae bacterium]|jgi:photosystem II stability/assembly factor-like uncharacterized protein
MGALRTAVTWLLAGMAVAGAVADRPADAAAPALAADNAAGDLPSEPERLATRALLLDIASAGPKLVVVGDRGIVLASSDHGHTWSQSQTPTQSLLTGVCFFDADHGVAVGHDEVILVTSDAGQTWKKVHYAPEAQQPLLDVWCDPTPPHGDTGTAAQRAIAVGAYGTYFVSNDRGVSWDERKMHAVAATAPAVEKAKKASPEADATDDGAGGGFHLNAIADGPDGPLYIAAEAGHLYRSSNRGDSWAELPSPYTGSFFGVLPLDQGAVLAFGLRGNLFRSEDGGLTWQRINTGTEAMLDGGASAADGAIRLVGLSGVTLLSHDRGKTFTLMQRGDRKGLAAVAINDDTLITVGEAGVVEVPAQ